MTKLIAKYDGYYSLANLSADSKRGVALTKKKYREHVVVFDTAKGSIVAEQPLTHSPNIVSISPDGKTVVFNDKQAVGGIPQDPEFAFFLIIWNIEKNTTQKFPIEDIQNTYDDIAWITDTQFVILSFQYGSYWDVYMGETSVFRVASRFGGGHYLYYHQHLMIFEHDLDKTTIFYADGFTPPIEIPHRMCLMEKPSSRVYLPTRGIAIAPNNTLSAMVLDERKSLGDDANLFKKKIVIWDIAHNQHIHTLVGERELTALSWSPDSTRLLVSELNMGKKTSHVILWNTVTGQKEADFAKIDGYVDNIIWSGGRVYISTQKVYVDPVLTVWEGK
ncbi:MAG: hypothetical protein SFZ02_14835 [bacterium]|nr:hypothetical protein [bacterium]